jgi:precorrin-2 dehydrogenase/sirohydrochlorin ferrochelatase
MRHVYPILLEMTNRPVTIVGGGAVAARKAAALLAGGATQIRAVAPKFVRDFPEQVQKIADNFAPVHLDGAALVFAATDSAAVNDAVVAEARQRGIWVNRADPDEDDPADFATPAVLRCGAITVAVSASGSPALAAVIRDLLAGSLGNEWINLAEASRELRPRIKSAGLPITKRREIFRDLATPQAAAAVADSGADGLWEWIRNKFPELSAESPNINSSDAK